MKKVPLTVFVSQYGQGKAAKLFGVRQSAISKAIALKRNITVIVHEDGRIEAEEIKAFPGHRCRHDLSRSELNPT
ncbi:MULTISPECIES: Cro/CI family transcriptional regulator [Serratia]|uniref:Cro/Cl family transcriptional regulator n=1 Tax=Serratia marcescens TaxID=615 RepID=A0A9X8YS55_SERMA|nr:MULTISPECIES: Cro/CI family transcriptional regulator [Serratia]MBS3894877.1 hypothetical protein [Serratia marcescens]